jgi:Fe-S-cluster containining protein
LKKCKQCGTCCRKGGPALHQADLGLIQQNLLPLSSLITIRKGEPVFSPISGRVEPAKQDLLKVSTSRSWSCPFLEESGNTCKIYAIRPVECRLLQCWNPAELENIIYRDNISRWDVIATDAKIFLTVKQHEERCRFADIEQLAKDSISADDFHSRVDQIIEKDLALREQAIKKFGLSLEEELFYFGRPLFKSLEYYSMASQKLRSTAL